MPPPGISFAVLASRDASRIDDRSDQVTDRRHSLDLINFYVLVSIS